MLKPLIAFTLFLMTANCFAQTTTVVVDSPETVFDHFANGVVRADYENYLRAHSLSKKKLLLLQAIQGVALYYEDDFNALCAKHEIPFEQIVSNAGGTDSMLNCILSCANVDCFIQDMLKVAEEANRENDGRVESRVEMKGVAAMRANGIHHVYIDKKLSYSNPIHFRRYCGRWTVCTENEWENESHLMNLDAPAHNR